jgi:ABC-2 type transport system permease protein
MSDLAGMIWIELRKAFRSRIPLGTLLASLFMPFSIAFLILLARNPDLSRRLGLVSAKADLIAYSAVDWRAYLTLFAEIIAAGGFFFFIMAVSWVYGREFADGTVKDMLAVPVPRLTILLAKFILAAAWSAAMAFIIYLFCLLVGAAIQLPGGSPAVILHGSAVILLTSAMVIAGILPFALIASIGRGYLLPMGMAVLTLLAANILMILGWAEYFPWAVPMLYAQGEYPLPSISYWIVFLTCLAGMAGTYLWWMVADQNR